VYGGTARLGAPGGALNAGAALVLGWCSDSAAAVQCWCSGGGLMGRPRKTLAEKAARLPRKYRPSERIASWPLVWDSALGIEVESELIALSMDLGGWEQLSRQKQILVERVVFLYMWVKQYETALFQGEKPPFDHGAYFNKVNTLHGHLRTLGLERQSRPVRTLREVMNGVTPIQKAASP
jgi:hypothetical protein